MTGQLDDIADDPVAPAHLDLPDDPAEAISMLTEMVVEARDVAGSYLNDLQRLAAEFENYRKRAERDRGDMVASASRRVVEALLPVLDSLDAAAATAADSAASERMRDGLLTTRDLLLKVLASDEVAPLPVEVGDPFDPALHEAVAGGGDGHLVITTVMRRGYRMGDRLLRPAMVSVAAEPIDPSEA